MKLEVLEKECYYHIYNRGVNGCIIFENDENKNFFLRQLSKYLLDNVAIVAYCLMDNHFHLVVQLKAEQELVTQSFSNFFNSSSIETISLYLIGNIPLFMIFAAAIAPIFVK